MLITTIRSDKEEENGTFDLLFINPEFHKGLNTTVRNGDKWMKKVEIGDTPAFQKDRRRVRGVGIRKRFSAKH